MRGSLLTTLFVTVVWERDGRTFSRTQQAGQRWGAVLTVGGGTPKDIDVDDQGNVPLIWGRWIMGDRGILLASRRPDGGAWSPPHRLSRGPQRRHVFLNAGIAHLDNPDVIWLTAGG